MIYCLMGKSASGKDTIYRELMSDAALCLSPIIPYTTRPIRAGEQEGVEYHFTDIAGMRSLAAAGKVIESRVYHTVHGDWYYFTVDDGTVAPAEKDYLLIGTLEVYNKIKAYYGTAYVLPLYVALDDGERLSRALLRERAQEEPKYAELCRRYLADEEDFSEERLRAAGIEKRYVNNALEQCLAQIRQEIWTH